MPPTTVIFDLDGVLVDSRAVITGCLNHALVALGHAARPPEELYRFIGPPASSAFPELLGEPAGSPAVLACIAAYRDAYGERQLAETTVAPGIPEALAALAPRHRLAVATSKPRHFAEPLLSGLGLRERFEVVAGPGREAHGEDKTQTLARALEALGPTDAVMVGDTAFDIVAAIAHGLPSIGVTWGIGTAEELTEAGARRIAGAPGELPPAVDTVLG